MWGMTFPHCILKITKDNGASVLAGDSISKGQLRVCVSISSVILSSACHQQRACVVIFVYTVYTVVYDQGCVFYYIFLCRLRHHRVWRGTSRCLVAGRGPASLLKPPLG